ncbi:signal recognition particle-docking protein FtsY [Nocardia stercoris]|uniref:Signal recognition particle receptor FtsY n=1 Tax=Nocardia stercoris TaxID=2483361 RepID=A0A3M2LDS5_9NOCA|nr:signal recognition particle-docking protein FtsY [Nocardia stercoris]RMI35564.1 signal recognition particle-docking protein FtsY [Nocardia stercoris]
MNAQVWILLAVIAALVLVAFVSGFVLYRRRRVSLTAAPAAEELTDRSGGYTATGGFNFSQGGGGNVPAPPVVRTDDEGQPHVGDDAAVPRDSARRSITDVPLPETETETDSEAPADPAAEPVAETGDAALLAEVEAGAAAEETTAPAPDTAGTAPADATIDTAPAEAAADAAADAADGAAAEATAAVETDGTATEATAIEAAAAAAAAADAATAAVAAAPAPAETPTAPPTAPIEHIEPTDGRLTRLRGRLARSQNAVGRSLLGLLGGGDLDEESWEEVEDTLLLADLGTASTTKIVDRLRAELASHSVRTSAEARQVLTDVLVEALRPEMDRSIHALPHADHPAILLVVGVNGTGKTTTTGKLARVLVADGRRVLLGAADTFRAAAADQLQTWGERVGASTVRGREGADPASVAFDAVSTGIEQGVDAVLVDTAGRLHTKTGLMDELGKVKRVVEKKAEVDEVLLVLDATVGQNGLMQARVFADVVDITGVVLTKLDGTAKGGIVFQVQHELGVPVKLVGLGEGADDLAPFEPAAFVAALLG